MASLIEDLIRGTADATAQMADDNIKFNRQKELMNQQMANQKSLADYNAEISQKLDQAKQELAERMRRSRASDIQAEVGRMADQQIGQQYKTADESADTTGEDYGNEVQRANGFINQAQQEARKNFTPTGKDLLRASVNLGYENPDKLATIESSEGKASEANLTKMMLQDQRNQTLAMIAAGHDQTRQLVAGMMATTKKDGSNKEDRVIVHNFLQQFDRKITSNDGEIKSLRGMLKNNYSLSDEEKKDIQQQIADLQAANKNLTSAQYEYARASGVAVPDSLLGGAGAGAGKDALPMPKSKNELVANRVYQTARGPAKWDGKQFVQ